MIKNIHTIISHALVMVMAVIVFDTVLWEVENDEEKP